MSADDHALPGRGAVPDAASRCHVIRPCVTEVVARPWFSLRRGWGERRVRVPATEHWANRDDLAMGQQLGWNPPTPLYLARMLLARRRAHRR